MAMKTKEIQENLVQTMRSWQGVERRSIASTGAVIGKTTSPLIDAHLKLEEEMVGAVNTAIGQVRGRKMGVQEYLLNFLVEDEKKHANLLISLATIKSGLYKVS